MNATCYDFICLYDPQRKVAKISEIFHEIFTHLTSLSAHLNNVTPFAIQRFPESLIVLFNKRH